MSVMILIAGVPASGKTTFAKYLSEQLKIPMVSKDTIKEYLFDSIGFKNRAEKVSLAIAATNIMYHFAEIQLSVNQSVILENNFEDITKPKAEELIEKYKCKAITILFHGDVEVIAKRFAERDNSHERHRGHVVNTQYPESENNESEKSVEMSPRQFKNACEQRGMLNFKVGKDIITVDSTDFSKVSYEKILSQVRESLEK